MDLFLIVKTLHILSATVLFGTGIGIAFFMAFSYFTDNIHEKYFAARATVLADCCFTLPAVAIQPVTGVWLIHLAGYDGTDRWLMLTYGLYLLAGLCWIPVVCIQIERMAAQVLVHKTELPERYHRLFRVWFTSLWPAFAALVIVFFLMVARPV